MASDFPDWGPAVRAGRFVLAGSGVAIVAVLGVAVPLRAATPCQQVMLKARGSNVNAVFLGAANVTADENVNTGGFQLAAGDIVSFPVDNLANVFVSGSAGDGVTYAWWT